MQFKRSAILEVAVVLALFLGVYLYDQSATTVAEEVEAKWEKSSRSFFIQNQTNFSSVSASTFSYTLNKVFGVYTQQNFIDDLILFGFITNGGQIVFYLWTAGSILVSFGCGGDSAAAADSTCGAIAAALADPTSALSIATGATATLNAGDDGVMWGLMGLIALPIIAGILGFMWLKSMMTPVAREVVEVPQVAYPSSYPVVEAPLETYAPAVEYASGVSYSEPKFVY
jgi:hypothetical protein